MFKKSLFLILIPVVLFAQNEKVKVTGEYTYTYGDNESLLEAKSLCYTMAIRNAIESLTVYVESTATVDNYQLKNDLVQIISSGYIEELNIDNETINGRTVYYKISGIVNLIAVKQIIHNKIKTNFKAKLHGIDENNALKILKISESHHYSLYGMDNFDSITVLYQAKDGYDNKYIMIDYYDYNGDFLPGDKTRTESGLMPGEIRTVEINKPANAYSYRVWLVK